MHGTDPIDGVLASPSVDGDWRRILEMLPAGVLVHQAGSIVYVNPSAARMLGAGSPRDLVGRPALDIVHPDYRGVVRDRIRQTIASHDTAPVFPEKLLRCDGTAIDAEVSAVPFVYNGEPAVFVTARDVTERNRAEEGLRRSEEKFRVLFDSATDPLFIHDVEGRVLEVNRAACERLGYSREELLAMLPLDIEAVEPRVLGSPSTRSGPAVSTLETAYRRRDGTVLPVELTTRSIVFDAQAAILSSARDISDRLRAARDLLASTRFNQAIIDALAEHICVLDESGTIIAVNRAWRDFAAENPPLGTRAGVGANYLDACEGATGTGEATARRVAEGLRAVARDALPGFECEYACHSHAGQHWFLLRATRLPEEGPVRIVVAHTDITTSKRAEEALRAGEAELRQAQRLESIGQLAAGIAHDLNNLLQPILGYSELMLADARAEDANYQSTLQIVEAGQRSRDLIRQLLAFGRSQALQTKTVDVRTVVGGMSGLLRRAVREDVEVHMTSGPAPCLAVVDPGQIEQVLMNLAVNAQDAMPGGGVLAIDVSIGELEEHHCITRTPLLPGRCVLLTVSDTGVGMDEETRLRMFEPFFTTKGMAGTGLGLTTVYGIVRQHGGHILVDSAVGQGTTFRVYLPGTETDTGLGDDRDRRPAPRGAEVILVVEDDDRVRRLTSRMLERHGYRVIVAASGAEALEAAAGAGRIDLLVSDVVMPGIGGAELFEHLSADRPGLRVLFMSGYGPDVIARYNAVFASRPLLHKPFTVHELTGAVRSALDGA